MRPFAVVLLDLNLPLLSGVEVCRHIKTELPSQPVIICSAAIVDANMTSLRAMNVEQFLTKPYHPRDLLDRIDAEISQAQGYPETADSGGPGGTALSSPVWKSARGHSVSPSSHTLFKTPILD